MNSDNELHSTDQILNIINKMRPQLHTSLGKIGVNNLRTSNVRLLEVNGICFSLVFINTILCGNKMIVTFTVRCPMYVNLLHWGNDFKMDSNIQDSVQISF